MQCYDQSFRKVLPESARSATCRTLRQRKHVVSLILRPLLMHVNASMAKTLQITRSQAVMVEHDRVRCSLDQPPPWSPSLWDGIASPAGKRERRRWRWYALEAGASGSEFCRSCYGNMILSSAASPMFHAELKVSLRSEQ